MYEGTISGLAGNRWDEGEGWWWIKAYSFGKVGEEFIAFLGLLKVELRLWEKDGVVRRTDCERAIDGLVGARSVLGFARQVQLGELRYTNHLWIRFFDGWRSFGYSAGPASGVQILVDNGRVFYWRGPFICQEVIF